MNNSVITVRTDKRTKDLAVKLYESLGLNLSTAINMFLKQSIIKKKIPFELETVDTFNDAKSTYPKGYFKLFGAGKNLQLIDIDDIDISLDGEIKV